MFGFAKIEFTNSEGKTNDVSASSDAFSVSNIMLFTSDLVTGTDRLMIKIFD